MTRHERRRVASKKNPTEQEIDAAVAGLRSGKYDASTQHIIDSFAMDTLLVKLNEACMGEMPVHVLQVSMVLAINAIAQMGGNSGALIEHAKQQLDRLAVQLS
jgi:hypothetical protein